jgi:hypothetical protein
VDRDGWRFEPVPQRELSLRFRGQVSPTARRIGYEVFVAELSADPYPTLRAEPVPLPALGGLRGLDGQEDGRAALAGGVRQRRRRRPPCSCRPRSSR